MGRKIENSIWVVHGLQNTASASVRRAATLSDLRIAPRARRYTPKWVFNFTTYREKSQDISKKPQMSGKSTLSAKKLR